jgi:hypothetical protein
MTNDEASRARDHAVSHFVCALVDVLGQQNELRQLDKDEDFYELHRASPEFEKRIGGCRRVVENIRLVIQENIARWYPSIEDLQQLPELQQRLALDESKQKVAVTTFSDLVLAYGSIDSTETRVPMAQVWSLVCAVMFCQLSALAHRYAIRGGIELGLGFEFGPGDLYGPVLSRVYSIESDVADYPRVVVGPRLHRFVDHVAEAGYEGNYSVLNQSMAQNILSCFRRDHDGLCILDFSGASHFEWIKGESWPASEMYEAALDFVREESARFAMRSDSKLVARYMKLLSQLESNRSVWSPSRRAHS